MESETPPRASPPHAMDDTEVLSQRTSPSQGEVRKAAEMAPEGNASAAENMGGTTPMGTDDGGLDQSGPQPNTTPETHMAPESSEQPSSREGGVPTPPATSINPEVPDMLTEALECSPVVEEHNTLMGAVVEKV